MSRRDRHPKARCRQERPLAPVVYLLLTVLTLHFISKYTGANLFWNESQAAEVGTPATAPERTPVRASSVHRSRNAEVDLDLPRQRRASPEDWNGNSNANKPSEHTNQVVSLSSAIARSKMRKFSQFRRNLQESAISYTNHGPASSFLPKSRHPRDVGEPLFEESSGEKPTTLQTPEPRNPTIPLSTGRSTARPEVTQTLYTGQPSTTVINRESKAIATTVNPLQLTGLNATATTSAPGDNHRWLSISLYWSVQYNSFESWRERALKALDEILRTIWFMSYTLPLVVDFGSPHELSQIRVTYHTNQHAITGYSIYVTNGPHAQRTQVQWTHVLTVQRQNVSAKGPETVAGFSGIGRTWKVMFLHTVSAQERWCSTTYDYRDRVLVEKVEFFGSEVKGAGGEMVLPIGHWVADVKNHPMVLEHTGEGDDSVVIEGIRGLKRTTYPAWKPVGEPRHYNNWFFVLDYRASYTMTKLRIVNDGCDWQHDVKAFTLHVSLRSSPYDWTLVTTVTDVAANYTLPQYYAGFSASGRYWKVTVTETYSGLEPWLRPFHLYGIKDSPYLCREFDLFGLDLVVRGSTWNYTRDEDDNETAVGTVLDREFSLRTSLYTYDVKWVESGRPGQYFIGNSKNTRRFDLFPAGFGCRRDVPPDMLLPFDDDICCVPGHIDWNPQPELSGLRCSHNAQCRPRVCGLLMTGNPCACDKACRTFGDCCYNYEAVCGDDVADDEVPPVIQPDSCKGRCDMENIVSVVTCNCTSSCNTTQTCCDDFEDVCQSEKDDGNWTSSSNWTTAAGGSEPLQCVAPWKSSAHFWMVASCPPGYTDDVVRGMCETSDGHVDMFLHAPVTDNSTDTNYRNVFCALCNDARYMLGWKMVAKCGRRVLSLKEILQRDKGCQQYFRPSGYSSARLCFPPHTTAPSSSPACDVEKCRNITALFFAKGVPFRNSACANCYADKASLWEASCTEDDFVWAGFFSTITVLFDYSNIFQSKMSSRELELKDHTESCSVGYIYDPFRGSCRQISPASLMKFSQVPGVEETRGSLENDPDNVLSAPTLSIVTVDSTPTPHTVLPKLSATFIVVNTVTGASASVSILSLLSSLRHHPRPDTVVKICFLTSLLLAQISQVVGQVVPSAACCTAMLVCTLCFCFAAGLSLTATIHHLSILQRGGTCKVAGHLLVILLIPLAMSGGYIALDDSIRMGTSQESHSFPHCWIQDPTKMAIFVAGPFLICTIINLYYLLRIAMRCAAADCMQYFFLTQAALLFLPYTVAMTTGILTAFVGVESLRSFFLYMVTSLGGIDGFLFLVFSIVDDENDNPNDSSHGNAPTLPIQAVSSHNSSTK
ncbi:hypothetical protein Bbelb_298370 [Branchiostoma belcheri]|nr:hypothetical protein Bbelb_298370 [Branchiostoma belcheri]